VDILPDVQGSGEKILISSVDKVGIVLLQGIEKYMEKHALKKCFLITSAQPHENVLKYAEHIQSLKIIISSDFREEKEKIEKEYPDTKIITVDSYYLAGRDGMLDGD
jgi:hypothetical protein